MEHVFDNVTYRRLLIAAKACAPRDLWIKWTRLDEEGTYTVSNHVTESDICFEICDDVPEKIREREYRYLIAASGLAAYKNAMSRKNFTEWRELVKRVIKRGEVEKLDASEEKENASNEEFTLPDKPLVIDSQPTTAESDREDVFDSEISLKLQSVLENYDVETDEASDTEEEDINPDITELLRTLLAANAGDTEDSEAASFENPDEEAVLDSNECDVEDELPPFDIDENTAFDAVNTEETEETLDDENSGNTTDDEAFVDEEVTLSLMKEDDIAAAEESEDSEENEAVLLLSELACYLKEDDDDIAENTSRDDDCDTPPLVSSIADALSDFDYDNAKYEELEEKEREISELKLKNEALCQKIISMEAEQAKYLELIAEYEKEAEEIRAERQMLIESLDAAKRKEERERDRLAEAAKIAIEERYESEKPIAENEELAAIQRRNEEEKIAKERAEARILEDKKQEQTRLCIEEETRTMVNSASSVRYVSKVADITFRHPVDPNITKRIQEIIVTTVKYFGKEDVYMKIKATIPDPYMVRLEFLKIPENESALLSDIIRVLGHSKIGIVKVLLN